MLKKIKMLLKIFNYKTKTTPVTHLVTAISQAEMNILPSNLENVGSSAPNKHINSPWVILIYSILISQLPFNKLLPFGEHVTCVNYLIHIC